jgi:hypothetical protein
MCGESDRKRRIDMSHDGPGSAHLHSPLTPQLRELTYVFWCSPSVRYFACSAISYMYARRASASMARRPRASPCTYVSRFGHLQCSIHGSIPVRRHAESANLRRASSSSKTSEAKTQRERLRRHESRPDTQLTSTGPRATSPRPTTGHLPVRYPSRLFVTVPDHVHTVVH